MTYRFAVPPTLRFSRLRPYFALSRTPHGLIDMMTPGFAALLYLGHFPPPGVTLLGLLTAFAGYTAVYALNDVVDYKTDRERMQGTPEKREGGGDLDARILRHPLAQGAITYGQGIRWTLFWGAVAIGGAYLLNPVCAGVFLTGCALEALYCLLFRVSPVRTLVNGVVKTLGSIAALFAVDPSPSPVFALTLFATLLLWEIGGQNIPNDCSDLPEDLRLGARTFPVVYGTAVSAFAALATLIGAALLTFPLFALSPLSLGPLPGAAVAAALITLLLIPGIAFYRAPSTERAMALFNRASHFPAVLFAITLVNILL